jgi:hypothetical protein
VVPVRNQFNSYEVWGLIQSTPRRSFYVKSISIVSSLLCQGHEVVSVWCKDCNVTGGVSRYSGGRDE